MLDMSSKLMPYLVKYFIFLECFRIQVLKEISPSDTNARGITLAEKKITVKIVKESAVVTVAIFVRYKMGAEKLLKLQRKTFIKIFCYIYILQSEGFQRNQHAHSFKGVTFVFKKKYFLIRPPIK